MPENGSKMPYEKLGNRVGRDGPKADSEWAGPRFF